MITIAEDKIYIFGYEGLNTNVFREWLKTLKIELFNISLASYLLS